MKTLKLLKRVVPLLREKEEIVSIPEKDKNATFTFIFACASSILLCLISFGMAISLSYSSASEYIIHYITSFIFLFIFCLIMIYSFNKVIIITNQRLICLNLCKIISIERENIETVTYDCLQRGLPRNDALIETKDNKKFKFQFYDYRKLKEELGVDCL